MRDRPPAGLARLVPAWLVLAAVAAVACTGGTPGAGTGEGSPSPVRRLGERPVISIPEGAPPAELVVETLVDGEDSAAAPGETLTVHWVGAAWSTGREFGASWDRGRPFTFELGAGFIPGWNQGLQGIRVGERRRLVVPPDLAYGDRGAGDRVGPDETLVFVVDRLPGQE